jgi:hypothetical protein
MVRNLLDLGVTSYGAMHYTMQPGNIEMFDLLLERGFQINSLIPNNFMGRRWVTAKVEEVAPLDAAISYRDIGISLELGPDITMLRAFLQRGAHSRISLHLAIALEKPEIVELLLSYWYSRNMSTQWMKDGEVVDISASDFAYFRLHHREEVQVLFPPLMINGAYVGPLDVIH